MTPCGPGSIEERRQPCRDTWMELNVMAGGQRQTKDNHGKQLGRPKTARNMEDPRMEDLQRLFRIGAEQFPAMMYVVVGWPEGDGAKGVSLDQNLLPADLRYNDDNLIESWIDQGYEHPGVRVREPRRFWLMRASTQRWNKAAALDTIRTLAAQVMPRLSGLCNDDSLFFPPPALFRIKEELCCLQDALSQWLCALYHFRRPEGDDLWYALPLERFGQDFYYYCLGDVFLQSVLACEVMLDQRTFDEFIKIAQNRKRLADGEGSANVDKNRQSAEDLTDTENNILEALGSETLVGRVLLKKAGYDASCSHYRQILSNLKKRNILGHDGRGYYKIPTQ